MFISNDRKLEEIQMEFHQKFPYLKIEFYSGHHEAGEGSSVRTRLNAGLTIGEARRAGSEGDLTIDEDLKVSTFENQFFEKYGLNVQVFRKSGNLWMQTTSTDSWTLSQQNRKGGSSTIHYEDKYNKS